MYFGVNIRNHRVNIGVELEFDTLEFPNCDTEGDLTSVSCSNSVEPIVRKNFQKNFENFFESDLDNKWQILSRPCKYEPLSRTRSKGHFKPEQS